MHTDTQTNTATPSTFDIRHSSFIQTNTATQTDTATDLHPDTPSARLGKIARLPAALRQTLNQRLENNEPSQRLVDWLNALPEVQQVLAALFEGRPISEQNLSAWKLGGFRDWQRAQQCRVRARDFLEEARELAEEVSAPGEHCSLLDRVGDRIALALLQLFREAEDGEPGPARTRTMLEIARELAKLRRGDHERQQAEILQQRWLQERDLAQREARAAEEKKQQEELAALCAEARACRIEFIRGQAGTGDLPPERERWIRAFFARHKERLREYGILGLPTGGQLEDELIWERTRPLGTQGGMDEALAYRHFWNFETKKAAASPDQSRPVKAAPASAHGPAKGPENPSVTAKKTRESRE